VPRPGRNTVGGGVYHVINRGDGRANVFRKAAAQLARIREALNRGSPLRENAWREKMPKKLGLDATIHPRGRPRKDPRNTPPTK
jgi:hypothetical protein